MIMEDTRFAVRANKIFDECVRLYHVTDDIDAPMPMPYPEGSVEAVLFEKNWIDAAQWHMEDIIRDPDIDPLEALALKRRIDASNQRRTDMVEQLDARFRDKYAGVKALPGATINTESPAWAIDRLSILALKIWHMREQAERADADAAHTARARGKLDILLQQREDLTDAIDTLLDDIAAGRKYMKVYMQMKLYNDPSTNPVLYGKK
ncbi:MAG TPA: hypothetical protein DC009_01245 [Porphyromonadaceae bacterium]|nr:hypothetical protein [Porphyromonadaceae bacterium]